MKLTVRNLRVLIREAILLEVTDPEKAAQRLLDLVRVALKNRANGEPALLGFMRTVGIQKPTIELMRGLLKKGNPVEAIAGARDIACAIFGYRPSSSSSMTSVGAADACDSHVAKKALNRLVA